VRHLPALDNPNSLLAAGGVVVVLAMIGGFLAGVIGGGSTRAPAQDLPAPAQDRAARPLAATLEVLGKREHWGSYASRVPAEQSAPQDAAAAGDGAAGPAGASGDDVQRSFVLVGIEGRGGQRHALLQYRDKAPIAAGELVRAPDANGIVRLAVGETLTAGIAVASIGRDHARLSTPGGETTLQLYESVP
jgi:hypothetical protein